jgi:membrane-associated phospholipid phosphatase
MATEAAARPRALIRVGGRSGRQWLYLAGPALMLASYALLTMLYVAIRAKGADLFAPADGERIERALFHTTPTRDLQDALYHHAAWLDTLGYWLHATWFWLPPAFCVVLLFAERRRLMEFMAWILAGSYIAALGFLFLPLRPPWMEPGISRILLDRAFISYTEVDNNPFASFPSMHAALPVIMGLFLLLRCRGWHRWLGWVSLGYSAAIGFALVYLGEHWTFDVLAGYALGGLVAFLFMSPWMQRLYCLVPGDPVAKLVRLNELMNTRPTPEADEREAAAPSRRAA